MEWPDKAEMVRLLNSGNNREATEFYMEHETWEPWSDVQALSMYANGINLTKASECAAIGDRLKYVQQQYSEQYDYLDILAALRVALLQDKLEKINRETKL